MWVELCAAGRESIVGGCVVRFWLRGCLSLRRLEAASGAASAADDVGGGDRGGVVEALRRRGLAIVEAWRRRPLGL